jgi:methanogenic corrinoid protein MtbC1
MFEHFRNDAVYNTRAVVQRTGVPADTIRAWERRYGVPQPQRTPGNQRLYSERDIAIVTWLRDQTREGLTISQAVSLLRSETAESAATGSAAIPDHDQLQMYGPYSRYVTALVDALVRFEGLAADRIVEEAVAVIPVEDVCLHILSPALIEIGEQWKQGRIGVATEHYASRFVLRKLSALFNASQPERGLGPVLAACVEEEQHEIGLLLTSLFLARGGYRVVYLGADVPVPDLVQAVSDVRPRIVMLSVSTAERLPMLVASITAVADASPLYEGLDRPLSIGYGGRVFIEHPEYRQGIPAEYLGSSARETVATVDRMMSGLPPASR